jgi:hypothetical protein
MDITLIGLWTFYIVGSCACLFISLFVAYWTWQLIREVSDSLPWLKGKGEQTIYIDGTPMFTQRLLGLPCKSWFLGVVRWQRVEVEPIE